MDSIAQATTASPTMSEQCIVASLTAEVMADPDDGQLDLTASTLGNLADLQVISPRALLQKVAIQRKQLDQIEALAQEYTAKVLTPAFLAEYHIELEELDTASLFETNPKLAAGFQALLVNHTDGRTIIAVPAGQTPTVRLAAIRDLLDHMQDQK
ncbi:hypothetical protein DMH12_04375 [Streptomyces sp. WAC 04229]|uniref:hypothetical protein n=1 Tax=Streptomyces sp. WAC 04229 TaxID=2203206 RepID=UPI000F73FCCC|nr:hypothetical protein [Streptomyces sp. WAC 04229]RSN64015.1 hypothetical protein DMH12_04375 [Streptomyces sp. WAC 04229]